MYSCAIICKFIMQNCLIKFIEYNIYNAIIPLFLMWRWVHMQTIIFHDKIYKFDFIYSDPMYWFLNNLCFDECDFVIVHI